MPDHSPMKRMDFVIWYIAAIVTAGAVVRVLELGGLL